MNGIDLDGFHAWWHQSLVINDNSNNLQNHIIHFILFIIISGHNSCSAVQCTGDALWWQTIGSIMILLYALHYEWKANKNNYRICSLYMIHISYEENVQVIRLLCGNNQTMHFMTGNDYRCHNSRLWDQQYSGPESKNDEDHVYKAFAFTLHAFIHN